MANDKSKRGSWMGHPLIDQAHEHDLHLAAALHEFQGGMPRNDAEKRALEDYRREHHARAAAHHFAGMKAGHATGNMDDAKKHHALYSLHVKALGEDPMGPVPEVVRKYHGSAGTDKKQRPVYSFRGHDADEFLVQPVTKAELEVIDLKKAGPTAQERAEVLRAAVNKAIAGISLDPVGDELVKYLAGDDAPPMADPGPGGRYGFGGVVDEGVNPPGSKPGAKALYEHLKGQQKRPELKKAVGDLKKTLDVLAAAKAVLAQLQSK
jgi:hypothetical protein